MATPAARLLCFALALLLAGCSSKSTDGVDDPNDPAADSPDAIKIVFTYGSEKEPWVKEATTAFNAAGTKIGSGKRVVVQAVPMGSGECIDEIITNRRQTHIVSPASAAFIALGNAQSRATSGKDVVGSTQSLVLSPVVIAMWRPMAEAIGWGKKPIGWSDVIALSKDPRGWAAYGHPEWGAFKFGHTHPEFSNSGLASVVAGAYASTGKVSGLSLTDVASPKVATDVAALERSVVHYGSSTGFFSTKMFANGPGYLSAIVGYESTVVDSYSPQYHLPFPVVAIYPKEGTFWSDHPVGIVDREWVTPDHREAAKLYIDFLLASAQQQRALTFGFRPSDPSMSVGGPIDAAHGVDPSEPKTTLETPPADVINALIGVWKANKRATDVVLVIDTSGSMQEDARLENAKQGALQFISMLGDEDSLSIISFNTTPSWALRRVPLKTGRPQAEATIRGLFPNGGTAIYDSVSEAYRELTTSPSPGKISAVVLLTDGDDTDSSQTIEALLPSIRFDSERRPIRVFTIGYGSGARKEVLASIADATQAKYYEGTPANIRTVLREISTFF